MKMTNSEKLDITVTAENCDNEDCFCGYFNDSGVNAGECSPQQVINELNYMYRSLVNKIDTGNGDSDLKIQTLLSWIKDLEEQNNVLVETVEELEKEAAQRVALLDERLQQTSHTALRYMTKLQDYDHQLQEVYRKHSIDLQSGKVNKEDKGIVTDPIQNIENEIWKKKYHETESELLDTKLQLKALQNELCGSRGSEDVQCENSELQLIKDENSQLQSELKNKNDQLRLQKLQHSEMSIKLENIHKYYSKEVDDLKKEIATKNAKITDLNCHIIELNDQTKEYLSKMKYEGCVIRNLRDKLKTFSSQYHMELCNQESSHAHKIPITSLVYNKKPSHVNKSHLYCSCASKESHSSSRDKGLSEFKSTDVRHQCFPELGPSDHSSETGVTSKSLRTHKHEDNFYTSRN